MNRNRILGYAFGVLTAASWATSPVLIRKGLEGLPSSLWGVTVGLLAATSLYWTWLLIRSAMNKSPKTGFVSRWPQNGLKLDPAIRIAIGFQALAGLLSGLGTMGRTLSIEFAPIVVAIPLSQTTSLFTLIFAPLLLGTRVEQVTSRLIIGALLVVAGSVLVVIGRNQ